MRIYFQTRRLQKVCSSLQAMEQAHGRVLATKLARRLAELGAAATLAEMSHLPPARCHALTGDRKGQFSVDLEHPYRLLFAPAHEPAPLDVQGGIDRGAVTEIIIIGVADTH